MQVTSVYIFLRPILVIGGSHHTTEGYIFFWIPQFSKQVQITKKPLSTTNNTNVRPVSKRVLFLAGVKNAVFVLQNGVEVLGVSYWVRVKLLISRRHPKLQNDAFDVEYICYRNVNQTWTQPTRG